MSPPTRDSVVSTASSTVGTPTAPFRNGRPRTLSISSDRHSTASHGLMSPPVNVSPEAAFIAVSAASQIVTNDHDSHCATWYDQANIEPSEEPTVVSEGALQLANNFVDQLLFNIVASARSTNLPALRNAAVEVLKPKLAKDAINQADEELREYLGGGEIDDLVPPTSDPSRDWDIELAWKRTRLRCMVYSSLGDMEEEDEDYYIEREHLSGAAEEMLSDMVSPAVAIFLTSILEFMGEQVLVVSGQAAFTRMRTKCEKDLKEGLRAPGDVAERLVVEDGDMERVALDRTLGRLWRAWKKRIRSPADPGVARPFSTISGFHSRQPSVSTDTARMSSPHKDSNTQKGVDENTVELDPHEIPLPLGTNDVAEIEVPGLVSYSDDETNDDEDDFKPSPRPKSWIAFATPFILDLETPPKQTSEDMTSAEGVDGDAAKAASVVIRSRSHSVPVRPTRFIVTDETDGIDESSNTESFESCADGEAENSSSLPSKIIGGAAAGVAAVGSAAMAGAAALTEKKPREPDTDFNETDNEEPKIMTSSRVSISGSSIGSRGPPEQPARMDRTSSSNSVRLVEVHSPGGSVDISERPRLPSQPSEPSRPSKTNREAFAVSSIAGSAADEAPVPPPRARTPPKKPSDQSQPNIMATASPPSKVTIINDAAPGTAISDYEDSEPSQKQKRPPTLPSLPEKSTSRQPYGYSASRNSPESPKLPRQIQPESPASARFKAVRSSEDSASTRPEDVARNFEQLIQSDQTLQYTLTPENMREANEPRPHNEGSPALPQKSRKSEDHRSRSSSLKRSISVSKSTGLNSHPPVDVAMNGVYSGSSPRSSPPVQSKVSSISNVQARDARIPRESMQDFADFIRSTGPPGHGPPKRVGTGGSSTNGRNVAAPPPVAQSPRPQRTSSRSNHQAREASGSQSGANSDLVDFLRSGPPGPSGPPTKPNTSRLQAPVVGGTKASEGEVRTSQASTNMTEASAPSSMNSQSALINKSKPPSQPANMFDDADMMPKRKQRRVRDPYALDFSDEDDDDLAELDIAPKPVIKKEESLIDFLNNYEPPPEPTPAPAPAPPKKKSSAPNLIARLRSNGALSSSAKKAAASSGSNGDSRSLNSRASAAAPAPARGYTPITVNIPSGSDKFADQFQASSFQTTPAGSGGGPRIPRKKFEPRDATPMRSETSDLAKFLRDSEPPPSTMASMSPTADSPQNSGFSRMFERRKKPVHG